MSTDIQAQVAAARIVPVIVLERVSDAVPLCRALAEGGLQVAEITFRTAAAPEALRLVAREFPAFVLGAGTVTTPAEVAAAQAAGARFAVAPGCNPAIIRAAQAAGLPFWPGVATPSEVEMALEAGCTMLKFFPAAAAGGIPMLKSLHAAYQHRGVRFMPTGGIEAATMGEWLKVPGVIAVGGTWMVAPKLIAAANWAEITRLTAAAVAAARA